MKLGHSALWWLQHRIGIRSGDTQLTASEQECLVRHAAGKHHLVELGVMHGVTTALLRRAMDVDGTVTGIDPHPRGRLGVSFERLIARREVGKYPRGRCILLRKASHDAVTDWITPIDFLFIDADHSWAAVDRDWRDWNSFVVPGGIVALHDSRSVPWRADLDSVRYVRDIVTVDPRFRGVDAVDSLTVLERLRDGT